MQEKESYFDNLLAHERDSYLHQLTTYAENLYSYKWFQSVPNAVRFYLEALLINLCTRYKISIITDSHNHLDIDKTITKLINYHYDESLKKSLRQCQKKTNEGSHMDESLVYENQYIQNAKDSLKYMSELHRWFSKEFYNEELPYNYSFPEFNNTPEDLQKEYNKLEKQFDALEKEHLNLLKGLNTEAKQESNLQKLDYKEYEAIKKQAQENEAKSEEIIKERNDLEKEKAKLNKEKLDLKTKQKELEDSKKIFECSQKSIVKKEKKLSELDIWEIKHENERMKAVRKDFEAKLKADYDKKVSELQKNYSQESRKLKASMKSIERKENALDKKRDQLNKIIKDKVSNQLNILKLELKREYENKENELKSKLVSIESLKRSHKNEITRLINGYNIQIRRLMAMRQADIDKKNSNTLNKSNTPQQKVITPPKTEIAKPIMDELIKNKISPKLYNAVKNAIITMYTTNSNMYITRNTIRNFLLAENTPIISTFGLSNKPGYGSLSNREEYQRHIEDILYYLEDSGVVSSNCGYYKLNKI